MHVADNMMMMASLLRTDTVSCYLSTNMDSQPPRAAFIEPNVMDGPTYDYGDE